MDEHEGTFRVREGSASPGLDRFRDLFKDFELRGGDIVIRAIPGEKPALQWLIYRVGAPHTVLNPSAVPTPQEVLERVFLHLTDLETECHSQPQIRDSPSGEGMS